MSVAVAKEKCPYCRESIAPGAVRCKHCHADLAAVKKKKSNRLGSLDTFRTGFLSGTLFVLILVVLAYLQFR
jgi:hypothetical protein